MAEIDYFSEASIAVLEENLRSQVSSRSYDGKALRGLLKLYAMFPARANRDNIVTVLTKSEIPFIATLTELEELLQSAKFESFWTRTHEPEVRTHLDAVPGFDDAVRVFVLKAVSRTYQKIEAATLATFLNVDAAEAGRLATGQGWTLEGTMVALPLRPENTFKPVKVVEDPLTFQDLSALVQLLSR